MLKIEKLTEGTITVLRLVGRINAEHLDELRKLIADAEPRLSKLDLTEVTLVDVDVVRFLGGQERRGGELGKCSPYIREWFQKTQTMNSMQRKSDTQFKEGE